MALSPGLRVVIVLALSPGLRVVIVWLCLLGYGW